MDDLRITREVRIALNSMKIDVRTASDAEEGLRLFAEWMPDLVMVDLLLQDSTGIDVCRRIRLASQVPLLIMSTRDLESDKLLAFEAGADDYITQPIGKLELSARVRARLRRAPKERSSALLHGDFAIDPGLHTATICGNFLRLTPKEFDLLLHLMRNAGRMTTHRSLLVSVWGEASAGHPEYLRVCVGKLRKKLEALSGKQYIETEPWYGYRLVPYGVGRQGVERE